jgi:hypothetical protein
MSRVTWLLMLAILLTEETHWGDGCPALIGVAPLYCPLPITNRPMLFGHRLMAL